MAGPHSPGRLGRRAGFAAAAVAFAVTMLGTTLPTPLYGLYRERFGFSVPMITVIFATYAVGVTAAPGGLSAGPLLPGVLAQSGLALWSVRSAPSWA